MDRVSGGPGFMCSAAPRNTHFTRKSWAPLRHCCLRARRIIAVRRAAKSAIRILATIAKDKVSMRYLHTMVRVSDLDASLDFYVGKLGLVEVRRMENEKGRFTLVFLATPDDAARIRSEGNTELAAESPVIELTYNWDEKGYAGGRNFGHLAYRVKDIYALCQKLMDAGVTINRPPRDGHMAFIRSPDGISIELLQEGTLPPAEPWASMPNTGSW